MRLLALDDVGKMDNGDDLPRAISTLKHPVLTASGKFEYQGGPFGVTDGQHQKGRGSASITITQSLTKRGSKDRERASLR